MHRESEKQDKHVSEGLELGHQNDSFILGLNVVLELLDSSLVHKYSIAESAEEFSSLEQESKHVVTVQLALDLLKRFVDKRLAVASVAHILSLVLLSQEAQESVVAVESEGACWAKRAQIFFFEGSKS